jgi:N6-L-threonylcarbamoyladenine synthase
MVKMKILAIETSCDDTCASVLIDDRVQSNMVSSQTDLYKEWGGVVPDIAKRAHMERIRPVIEMALKRAKIKMEEIEVIAVTKGPGLAIALSVGVNTARELAIKYNKPLVAVNHIEGHILANLAKNKLGKPEREIKFPALALTVSGGHTKIVWIKKIGNYEVVGETLDDAAGEALDKAAKLLGLGYPGGPVIEIIAKKATGGVVKLPKPLADKKILDYSFSGLKTSFYYQIKDWSKEKINSNLANLAADFQDAVFELLIRKFKLAIEKYQPKTLLASGGVLANLELRKRLRKMAREYKLPILMPVKKILNTDNAAMIGVAGYYRALRKDFADPKTLDRDPRWEI